MNAGGLISARSLLRGKPRPNGRILPVTAALEKATIVPEAFTLPNRLCLGVAIFGSSSLVSAGLDTHRWEVAQSFRCRPCDAFRMGITPFALPTSEKAANHWPFRSLSHLNGHSPARASRCDSSPGFSAAIAASRRYKRVPTTDTSKHGNSPAASSDLRIAPRSPPSMRCNLAMAM